MNDTLTLQSPAKINRYLHVLGKRQDGYHELDTLFQFLRFGDTLNFCLNQNELSGKLTRIDLHDFELPEKDLIYQAAKLLRGYSDAALPAVTVTLTKNIPTGSGLGGGSSNAATTLMALNVLWKLNLADSELLKIAISLGADVPIFIRGQSAIATGIGEIFTPYLAKENPIVLALPPAHSNTAVVFKHYSQLPNQKLKGYRAKKDEINDLEQSACQLYPEIALALSILRQYGDARMSGTGAAVYLLCENHKEAEHIQQLLQETHSNFTWICTQILNNNPTAGLLSQK